MEGVSVITSDRDGVVRQYSAEAQNQFGWTPDEVIGKMSIGHFHIPKDLPTLVPRILREATENGKFEEEVTLLRKDGATFHALLTVRPALRDGRPIGFMEMIRPLSPPTKVPVLRLWLQSLRAPFLVASIVPVLVGALAAWSIRGAFHPAHFALCLVGAMLIHLGANMANDAWDYRSGNDLAVRHLNPFAGGGRVLLRGVLNDRTHLEVALVLLGIGSLIGLYLVTQVGLPFLGLGLVGVAIAYSYVGPPIRLAHHGVGEIAVGLEFGPVTVLGTYFVLARAFDLPVVLLSISLGSLVAGILWINEVPDITADSTVGKRTLVVRLGVERATTVFAGLLAAAYTVLLVGVLLAGLTPWALLALLAAPLAAKPLFGLKKAGADPHALIPANAGMILATVMTGILLLTGLALSAF
jgi:1,4-dihydroxy-2-naphthoate octaprenyltransferase